jgi:hypothetical protein
MVGYVEEAHISKCMPEIRKKINLGILITGFIKVDDGDRGKVGGRHGCKRCIVEVRLD